MRPINICRTTHFVPANAHAGPNSSMFASDMRVIILSEAPKLCFDEFGLATMGFVTTSVGHADKTEKAGAWRQTGGPHLRVPLPPSNLPSRSLQATPRMLPQARRWIA